MNRRYILIGMFISSMAIYFLAGFVRGKYFTINSIAKPRDSIWIAPSLFIDRSVVGKERTLIIYGQDLIANTAKYLGPQWNCCSNYQWNELSELSFICRN